MMRKQAGGAMLPVLLALFGFIMIVRTAISVIPMYMQDSVVEQVLETLATSGEVSRKTSAKELRAIIERRLMHSQVKIPMEGLEIRRTRSGIQLFWDYEKRGGFFGNIELVGRFQHQKDFSQ